MLWRTIDACHVFFRFSLLQSLHYTYPFISSNSACLDDKKKQYLQANGVLGLFQRHAPLECGSVFRRCLCEAVGGWRF